MKRQISEIVVPAGRRSVDHGKVSALAESIKILGLLNPITVDKEGTLVAGAHRLEAHKLLGFDVIECVVLDCDTLRSELVELDENLVRNDLDPIGVGEHALRRDEILDALGLRAKQGDNRFTKDRLADSAPLQTTADIAKEIGMSERSLQVNKQLARDLIPVAKEAVRMVDATKQDALRLSRKNHEEQEAIAKMILDNKAAKHSEKPEAFYEVVRRVTLVGGSTCSTGGR